VDAERRSRPRLTRLPLGSGPSGPGRRCEGGAWAREAPAKTESIGGSGGGSTWSQAGGILLAGQVSAKAPMGQVNLLLRNLPPANAAGGAGPDSGQANPVSGSPAPPLAGENIAAAPPASSPELAALSSLPPGSTMAPAQEGATPAPPAGRTEPAEVISRSLRRPPSLVPLRLHPSPQPFTLWSLPSAIRATRAGGDRIGASRSREVRRPGEDRP